MRLKSTLNVSSMYKFVVCVFINLFAFIVSPMAFVDAQYGGLLSELSVIIPLVATVFIFSYVITHPIDKNNIKLLILPTIYMFLLIVNTYGGYRGGYILAFVSICCFLLLSKEMKRKCFHMFYILVQIANIFSIFMYVAYLLGINIGIEKVLYYSENASVAGLNYLKWGMFALYGNRSVMIRLCGVFNEPGALGTVCAFLFIATFRKTKWYEKVLLLIAGGLSFSFAFYMMIYIFAMCELVSKNIKNLFWFALLAVFFFAIPCIDFHNESLNMLAQRFAITSDGFQGDNRVTDAFAVEYDKFKNSIDSFFGYGVGAISQIYEHDVRGVGYRAMIMEVGYLGFGSILISWILAGYNLVQKNKNAILYIVIFIISLYQRCYLTNIFAYLLFFGGIEWIIAQEQNNSGN